MELTVDVSFEIEKIEHRLKLHVGNGGVCHAVVEIMKPTFRLSVSVRLNRHLCLVFVATLTRSSGIEEGSP